ncbi:MAG TPA: glutathione S-transferase family protein [Spongiibacteraceae bacterium]
MVKVFGMSLSGNCYKIKLLLEQLQQPYQWQEIDIFAGQSRTSEFLAMNSNGRVPVAEIEPGRYLAESNAILCYLAEDTNLWPRDKFARAQVLQWLFFEQYSHEPYIAVARFIAKFLPPDHPRQIEMPRLHERGGQALAVMEQHLSSRQFFVGEHYSIADIALFAYTHCAEEGGFDIAKYPAITTWLARVRVQPLFVAME